MALVECIMYGFVLKEFGLTCVYLCECWKFSKLQVFSFASNQIALILHVSNFSKKDRKYK